MHYKNISKRGRVTPPRLGKKVHSGASVVHQEKLFASTVKPTLPNSAHEKGSFENKLRNQGDIGRRKKDRETKPRMDSWLGR